MPVKYIHVNNTNDIYIDDIGCIKDQIEKLYGVSGKIKIHYDPFLVVDFRKWQEKFLSKIINDFTLMALEAKLISEIENAILAERIWWTYE